MPAELAPETAADPDELPMEQPLDRNTIWTVDESVHEPDRLYSTGTLVGRRYFTTESEAKEALKRDARTWLMTIGSMKLDEFALELSQGGTVLRIDCIGETLVAVHRRLEAHQRAIF